eukprot:TRINITY_DN12495_c0_g1_i10.p1 TRINITY_DN12495_c0_g1~~TRINITY_DN12495_c0_g1_i10.p1  ORF type:complete len:469 (+),score=140.40 TRINITY_DN12495_c0_g1_i10:72-1478(+)
MGGEDVSTQTRTTTTLATSSPEQVHIQLETYFERPAYKTSDNSANMVCRLVAPEYEAEESRPAVDIVTVFDVSGSMGGTKLNLAIETLNFMITNLKDTDRFGLVTFDTNVYTNFELTRMDQAGKAKASAIVAKLRAGSCTNLSGGLFKGIEMMQARKTKAPVASVLLMTDGLANNGIRDVNSLCATMKSMIGEAPDFTTYCFGYGKDHNSNMLQMVSEIGNGMYYYIETNDIIAESFGDCLGGLLSVVGQNITLTLQAAADGYTIKKVHTKKPADITAGGTKAVVSLGDLQAEETRDVLVEVGLPSLVNAHEESRAVLKFDLSYVNVVMQCADTASATARLSRPSEVPAEQEVNTIVRDAVDRQETVEGIAEARRMAEEGRFAEARTRVSAVRAKMATNFSPAARMYEDDLDECMDNMASASVYKAKGAHQMASAMQSHAVQRSNRVWADDSARGGYVTKKKAMMRKK